MAAHPDWTIRPVLEPDLVFVYSTWLNSMWRGYSSKASGIRKTKFFGEYPKVIDSVLQSPTTEVAIACHPDEPLVIYGYIVFNPACVYAVFVKSNFRKFGVGTSLYNYSKGKQNHGNESAA